jgi:hypothetical protein
MEQGFTGFNLKKNFFDRGRLREREKLVGHFDSLKLTYKHDENYMKIITELESLLKK